MMRITKKIGTGPSCLAALWSRLTQGALTTLAVASLVFTAANAQAACGNVLGSGSGAPMHLPMLGQAETEWEHFPPGGDSIVGLWHVVYTYEGALFNETLDQWHSDGTEFENAFLSPEQGNICFGVWKPVGPHKVCLHHIGWTFDPTKTETANGTFTLDETNTVSGNGRSYTGTFVFKTFNLKGVQQGKEMSGTIAATRITVD